MAKTLAGDSPPRAEDLLRDIGKAKGMPPVHLWNPPFSGDIDMRIARDGTWFYLGTPIRRPEMVRLFSTILKREGDDYFLVTPVEKHGIRVDDAPFVAVDFSHDDEVITFVTNVGDQVTVGTNHPIRVEHDPDTEEPAPYVHVRSDLWALIDRKSFYRLVDLGQIEGDWFGVRSGGEFYPLAPAAMLDGL